MNVRDYVNRIISGRKLKRLRRPEDFRMMIIREKQYSGISDSNAALIVFDTDNMELTISDTGLLVETIRSNTRTTDVVGWYDNGRIGLLMSDTSKDGAQRVLEAIMNHLKKRESSFNLPPAVIHTYSNGRDVEAGDGMLESNESMA